MAGSCIIAVMAFCGETNTTHAHFIEVDQSQNINRGMRALGGLSSLT